MLYSGTKSGRSEETLTAREGKPGCKVVSSLNAYLDREIRAHGGPRRKHRGSHGPCRDRRSPEEKAAEF